MKVPGALETSEGDREIAGRRIMERAEWLSASVSARVMMVYLW